MSPKWLTGVSIQGYGCSLAVGLGIPIPILNEEMANYTAISDEDIFTQVIDYGNDYPKGKTKSLGQVSYAELKSGSITVKGKKVPTVPLSSMVRAREIADIAEKKDCQRKILAGRTAVYVGTHVIREMDIARVIFAAYQSAVYDKSIYCI